MRPCRLPRHAYSHLTAGTRAGLALCQAGSVRAGVGQSRTGPVPSANCLAGLLATGRLAYAEGKVEMIAEFFRQARTRPGQSLPTGDPIRASPPSLTASMAHWSYKVGVPK